MRSQIHAALPMRADSETRRKGDKEQTRGGCAATSPRNTYGSRMASTAQTAMPSMTTLKASHQCEARETRGATALAAAPTKQNAIPALMARETTSGAFLTCDFGNWRVAETFCFPPDGFGAGPVLMRARGTREKGIGFAPL